MAGTGRLANGNFIMNYGGVAILELDAGGRVIADRRQVPVQHERAHHDAIVTPQNTVLFIALDLRDHDGRSIAGEAIWEWDPRTDAVHKRWSSWNEMSPDVDWGAVSRDTDWLHANSIGFGPSGNVLVSFHFLNQVVSIAPGYGAFQWRLGGVRATIEAPDPPFSGQHTARIVGPGRLLLFDNGFEREVERYSRAVEYALVGDGAEVLWEWRPERDNWARVISGAMRMSNGHTLVGFGTLPDAGLGTTGPIEVYEVDRGGGVRWHLEVAGGVRSMYRATPLDRL